MRSTRGATGTGLTRRQMLRTVAAGMSASIVSPHISSQAAEEPKRAGRLFVTAQLRTGDPNVPVAGLISIDPKEGTWTQVVPVGEDYGLIEMRVSPDARKFAALRRVGGDPVTSLWVGNLDADSRPRNVAESVNGPWWLMGPCWSPDGETLVAGRRNLRDPRGPQVENWRIKADGTDRVDLPMAASDEVVDWSPDGRWFVAEAHHAAPAANTNGAIDLVAVRPDGTDRRVIVAGGRNVWARISPESDRVVYSHFDGQRRSLWIVGIGGKGGRPLIEGADGIQEACWSPDGRSLAIVFGVRRTGDAESEFDYRIELFDVEEGARHPLPLLPAHHIGSPNWR